MALELVAVGASLGGLEALKVLLAGLSPASALPLAIVQHRDAEHAALLALLLQQATDREVAEAQDKEPILPGRVYLAPADYHLLVGAGHFSLSTEGPVHHARPSIDVLFESAAEAYRDRVLGVVLTGTGRDGAWGACRIRARGGRVVAQAPEGAQAPDLPRAAIEAGGVDRVLPLAEIAGFLNEEARGGNACRPHPDPPS